MKNFENPNFLKNKYNLHNAPEVEKAAKRTETKTGEKVPQDPEDRIQNYLDRLERLIIDPEKKQKREMFGGEQRPHALVKHLREMIMRKYVRPNKNKMAEGAARVEERAAREMGIETRYGERELEQRGEIAVEDLEKSLDNWILYLSNANEPYPTWFRYYAFRNILDLGDYDKDKGEFTKRSQGSTRLFPEIERGALAYIQERIEAAKDPAVLERLRKAQEATETPKEQLITKEKAEKFSKLSFTKQYIEGIEQAGEITPEMRKETRGKWIKYQQETDPTALWASLQNKGTAWCTKGFATAETQLKGGDFYVYYTLDKQGKPTIPRIAIRMEGDKKIAENPRGVFDSQQNLEPNMVEIMEKKIKEFGSEADRFKKKSADMKYLTEIENKIKARQKLNKNELVFIYEINSQIEGFGYQRDPRIKEIMNQRNSKEDMLVVFECSSEQVAENVNEVNENTRAYLGSWNMEVFQKIRNHPNIEYFYESFPDKKIFMQTLETDSSINSPELAENALKEKNMYLSDYGKDILYKTEFSKKSEKYELVRFSVKNLGFPSDATTDEIYKKTDELGLELCPAEIGPHLRLQYPGKEWMLIAMKQITDRLGRPGVFGLSWDGEQLRLRGASAEPSNRWVSDHFFVFRFRPSSRAELATGQASLET